MANGKRRSEQAESNDKERGNKRPQKIWKPWEATGSDQDRDIIAMDEERLPVMKEKQDIDIFDKPMEARMVYINDQIQFTASESDHAGYNIYLNLPDLPFSVLMMTHSTTQLRRLTQVSSSWKKRIQENILENSARQNDLRARIEKVMGPGKLPSIEEISDAIWLSKY